MVECNEKELEKTVRILMEENKEPEDICYRLEGGIEYDIDSLLEKKKKEKIDSRVEEILGKAK